MTTLGKTCVLCLSLLGISITALAGEVPTVGIAQDKIYMGDLVAGASPEIASLYFGPAPKPGQSRLVSRKEVEKRLQRARVKADTAHIPKRVRVKRLSQSLSEVHLAQLVRRSVQGALDANVLIKDVRVPGGVLLGKGKVRVELNKRAKYRDGWQTLMAKIYVDETKAASLPVSVKLAWPKLGEQGSIIVERGAHVTVIVRKGGVAIRTRALAQESGVRGATIAVIPQNGRKLVRAKVLDASTVEMLL